MRVAKFANVGKVSQILACVYNLPAVLLQLSPQLYIADCEDTDLEQIAKRCGGKRCVLYNSTTNCAECNEKCADMNGESSAVSLNLHISTHV